MLFNGIVIEAGGEGSLNGSALKGADRYDQGAFLSAGNMTAPRAAHTATVLKDGVCDLPGAAPCSVLITGGQSNGTSVATAELLIK